MTNEFASMAADGERDITIDRRVPVLEVAGLSKRFGGVQALDDVSMTVAAREVHGLLGENGSGKSTLIKVLAGFHAPEDGRLRFNGEPVDLPLTGGQARTLGLEFVHQHLGLITSLSVVENLRLEAIASSTHRWHISWARERRRAKELFSRYGLTVDPAATVAELRPVARAQVAIVRAVSGLRVGADDETAPGGLHGRLLVLDEPTAFLPKHEVDDLLALIRSVVDQGASVLFVSHNLGEVRRITDRVTVLRDGRVVATSSTAESSESALVAMVVGRTVTERARTPPVSDVANVGASVRGLSGPGVTDISLTLREGEVLGVTGLLGSGFEELPYLLFGARAAQAGVLSVHGIDVDLTRMSPARALNLEIALIPADRQHDGSVPSLSVADNVTLQVLPQLTRLGCLRRRAVREYADRLLEEFEVRPRDAALTYASLSGGNQQKVLLAKWLTMAPRLLLLHEPTQGVDVGARQQIYAIIAEAAARGMMAVCASSDYEELAAMCHRVVVVDHGRVRAEIGRSELSVERLTEECLSSGEDSATVSDSEVQVRGDFRE